MIAGVGIDVVELERVRGVYERHKERFTQRILTEAERAYCEKHRDPVPSIAGRFAAKEAVLKALGTGLDDGISWHDVEVVRAPNGAPSAALHRRAAERAAALSVNRVHLSLTHDRTIAAAVAVMEVGDPPR